MAKQQADAILHKIYRILKGENFVLRFKRGLSCYGMLIEDWEQMIIDPFSGEFIETCIHECLHMVYPEADETLIIKLEKYLIKHLTDRQVANFLKRIAKLIGGD